MAGASRACDLDLVKSLLAGRAAVNGVIAKASCEHELFVDPLHPLFFACIGGRLPIMKQLVEHRAIVDGELASFLHHTKLTKDTNTLQVAREITAIHADVNSVDACGRRPLHFAAENGWGELAKHLITCKANLNLGTAQDLSQTPFHTACFHGQLDLMEILFEGGESLDLASLHVALHRANSPAVVTKLVQLRANINSEGPGAFSALHRAAGEGSTVLVQRLIDLRADVQRHAHPDEFFCSPLWYACDRGHQNVVRQLLQCNTESVKTAFWTALTSWTYLTAGRRDVMALLVQEGANVNERNELHGWTPLQWVCFKLNMESVQVLLNHRAAPNIQDVYGQSPLHYASCYGHLI